jgi:hypothetical protein
MIKYTKKFTPLFITPMLLTACGGGENTNIYSSKSTLDQDVISSTQISGTAVKGVIKKGKVSAYGFVNGQINDLPLATSYTDSQGRYSLVIDNYNGPLFIEVSANSDTTMTCDIIDGCNGFLYGEDIPLDDEFSLKTAVSLNKSDKEVIANASVITTLAAELSENYNSIDEIVIQNANSQVANLLKINGDITKIDIIDVFNPTLGSDIDSEIKENSLLNPALISAALKIDQNKTISEGLNFLIDEFVKNDGQMVNHQRNDSQDVTLSNVFDEAYNLASRDSRFNDTKTNFMLLKENSILSSGEYTNAIPNKSHKMEDVEHAKDLIAKLKDLHQQLSIEDTQYPSAVAQLNLISSLGRDENFIALSLLLKKLSEAFIAAFDANMSELEKNNVPLDQYIFTEIDGSIFPVDIKETIDGFRYQMDSSSVLSQIFDYEINFNLVAKVTAGELEAISKHCGHEDSLSPVQTPTNSSSFNQHSPMCFTSLPDDPLNVNRPQLASFQTSREYELNISGELVSPHYNLQIADSDIDAWKYNAMSAWFSGRHAIPPDVTWDGINHTPPLYSESIQSDHAIGQGLNLNLNLNIEANQLNHDNPIAFLGKFSIEGNNHDDYSLYSRCTSKVYFPILLLGMEAESCGAPDDLNSTYEERPIYKDEIVLSGMIDESFMKLSGNLKQGENSVNGIFISSKNLRHNSWGGMSDPGDLSDLLDRSTLIDIFDTISGGGDTQAQSRLFDLDFDSLTALASAYPLYDNSAHTTHQLSSEITLNNLDHSFLRTFKDLLQLSTFNTAKYGDDPGNNTDENDRNFHTGNSENMLALGMKLENDSISDVNEIYIRKSDGSKKDYSVDIKFNSENLDFDITYHDFLNELDQFGSDRKYYEERLADYGPVSGEPFLSKGQDIFHDLLYDRERYLYQIPKLTVKNQNNTVLQLFEECSEFILNCKQLGTITVNGNTVANITYDYVKNNYIVNFNDGTSETL